MEPILNLMERDGVSFERKKVLGQVSSYLELIREWNGYASLVSVQDAESGLESHLIDSWTLVPWIVRNVDVPSVEYLDLGSGGGFPGIPICVLLGELRATLVDRSEKKTVFLKKVVRRLGLERVAVENRSFSGEPGDGVRLITSRAIEKPLEVMPVILESMGIGDVYLCQSPAIEEVELGAEYECGKVVDHYAEAGLRRSALYVVRRLGE